jgi:5-methylcytosine-specific restriction endonuclease McrA
VLFEYTADRAFFRKRLCRPKESLAVYADFFDFRSPAVKRVEFNAIMRRVRDLLQRRYGAVCQLQTSARCSIASGITVDHLIPLSSNKLNKEIRRLVAESGRKVRTQSFGSNHLANLVLACGPCNGNKMNRFLERDVLQIVLERKRSISS